MILALFVIVPNLKQPKCPSMDEWLKDCHTSWNTTQNKKETLLHNFYIIHLLYSTTNILGRPQVLSSECLCIPKIHMLKPSAQCDGIY